MDEVLGGATVANMVDRERIMRRRRLAVVRWWPCWTVAPALLAALLVFVPWYAWDLAPDYDLVARACPASCLVLAHGAPVAVPDSDLVIPRLCVRLGADEHGTVCDNCHGHERHRAGAEDTQTDCRNDIIGDLDAWAMPFFTERDSYMDAEGALAFLEASPVGTRHTCFYDPASLVRVRVAMHDGLPSLFRRLCLAVWLAAVAAVSGMAVCFGLVSRWAAL
ncbi:hypothetical protein pkur_cds_63 [Pandoravirus kuranda]|uniref:Uncharacterized protein n=1 Tax=Pandoravirus kuranda TaxID=3019033 RepID=A0AA95EG53_9VIRU|nr:hypothetical protein pkur_cds_63 [Pandoravirus kuranda]